MEFILSGYGSKPNPTIASFTMKEEGSYKRVWEDSVENASFVCEGDGYLFTITEVDEYSIVYLYQKKGSQYDLKDQRRLEGGALCHITYSSRHKALFGACYGTGTVFSIRVEEDKFGAIVYQVIQKGIEENDTTRAHCVVLNQQETQLIVANIALDRVYFYEVVNANLNLQQILELPRDVGPRHVLLSPDETLIYIITEYSNEILIYNIKKMQLIQRISTLREDFTEESYCSTLCFSSDRRYLYSANRKSDTIALFSLKADGELSHITEFDCGGSYPRHMIVSKDGAYLIVCNQNTDNVTIFLLNKVTGYLHTKIADIPFCTPSGVLEI